MGECLRERHRHYPGDRPCLSNQIAPQIEFCAFGVTGEVVVGTGACYILSGIAERVRELSKLAYQAVQQGMDDGEVQAHV